ncbi:nicotinate-nucleotide--dimethylbenzimidazole phosphoribosyltransferase [Streptomyces sp. NPDC087294]|uniref:nicotinate-nucleotide--dimethylbenzimidazole phosphoribosyltransferase n=1 Tax=Streptomyces sp. NPDC087294 TaxID=3365777 RepID=UPI0038189ABB
MTDTGQVPGEGLPENAGTAPQPGVPAHAAYAYLSETTAEDEDLLLLPGAQSPWGNEVAPPAPEPVVEAVHEPGPHETDGRDSGSVDLGGVRLPEPPPASPSLAAAPTRRPLHLGPPTPDASASPVRSLADRGPAGAPVRQPLTPPPAGPEYLDTTAQLRGLPPQSGAPWGAPAPIPVMVPTQTATATWPAETVAPAPEPAVPAQVAQPTGAHAGPPAAEHEYAPATAPAAEAEPGFAPETGVDDEQITPAAPEAAAPPEAAQAEVADATQAEATETVAAPVAVAPVAEAEVEAPEMAAPVTEVPEAEVPVPVPVPDAVVPVPVPEAEVPVAVAQAPDAVAPVVEAEVPVAVAPVVEAEVPVVVAEAPDAVVPVLEAEVPGVAEPVPGAEVPDAVVAAPVEVPVVAEGEPVAEAGVAVAETPVAEAGVPEAGVPEAQVPVAEVVVDAGPVAGDVEGVPVTVAEAGPVPVAEPEPLADVQPVAEAEGVAVAPVPDAVEPVAEPEAVMDVTPEPEQVADVVAPEAVAPEAAPPVQPVAAAVVPEAPEPAEQVTEAAVPEPVAPEAVAPEAAELPELEPELEAQPEVVPVLEPAAELAAPEAAQVPAPTAPEAEPVVDQPTEPVAGEPADVAAEALAAEAAVPAPVPEAQPEPVAAPAPVAPQGPVSVAAVPLAELPQPVTPAAVTDVAAQPESHEPQPEAVLPPAADVPDTEVQDPGPAPEPEAQVRRVSAGPAAPAYDDAERAAVLKVMRERRDIRNGFRDDPIPHDVLLRVLEAAHTAPSVGHSQPWDFVVIRSAETRRGMHDLAMRQRDAYAKSLPKGRAKQFKELKIEAILDTPVNIVVTADPTRGGRHTLGRHTQPQMAPYSSALAVENLWLAARAEGLGVGWVSFFDEREMVRALGLPEHLDVVAYLCVGYVDEFPDEPELMQAGWAKRRPLSWVVHEETYGRRALPGEDPHDLLAETVASVRPLDAKALGEAWERQKRMTKPAGALGMLEIISAQLSGLSRQCPPPIPEPAAVAIFAGDHGVHAQGVTPWPQEVTGQMVANFLGGGAVCNAFASQVGAEVCVVDVGVASELPATPGLLPRKVRAGTSDMTTGPAMTREEAKQAIEVGIETARDLVAAGNKALLTGEMGIANTTASAALIAVFTGADPAEVTGRGTGVNDETLARKTEVVRRAIELHQPDPADPIGVLAAVGGFEHAAIVGLLLGGASLRTPVILDGVSAGAAALVARAIAPEVLAACIAGHRSAEPGHVAALNKLGLRPLVDLDLRLGEGTGALLALPLVQSTARAMHEVATFDSAGVTEK